MTALRGVRRVFCDAGFCIALFSKKDRLHGRAIGLFNELQDRQVDLYTSWPVVGEAMTVLLYQYGYTEASTFSQSLDSYQVLLPSESQYYQAVAVFNLFNKDKRISLTDAISYVLITNVLHSIPALSFDADFKTLGLTTIS